MLKIWLYFVVSFGWFRFSLRDGKMTMKQVKKNNHDWELDNQERQQLHPHMCLCVLMCAFMPDRELGVGSFCLVVCILP